MEEKARALLKQFGKIMFRTIIIPIAIFISILLLFVTICLTVPGLSSLFGGSSSSANTGEDYEKVSSSGLPIYLDFIAGWEDSTVWSYLNGEIKYSSYLERVITEDKKYFICYTDGYGDRNYGYGVCHYTGSSWNNVEAYKSEGINIKRDEYNNIGSSKIDVETVMAVYKKEANSKRKAVMNQIKRAGISLNENQIDALTSIYYQYGNIGNFCEMYKKYGDTDELRQNAYAYGRNVVNKYYFVEVKPGGDNAKKRGQANWNLFHNGKYIVQGGKELDVNSYNKQGSSSSSDNNVTTDNAKRNKIISLANSKIGCRYKLGKRGPNVFDCSGLVYWLYKKVNINVPSTSDSYRSYIGSKKEISLSKAQPGDILHVLASERHTEYGHVAIYLDENTTIEAMGDKWGVCKGKVKGRFKHVFNFIDK